MHLNRKYLRGLILDNRKLDYTYSPRHSSAWVSVVVAVTEARWAHDVEMTSYCR